MDEKRITKEFRLYQLNIQKNALDTLKAFLNKIEDKEEVLDFMLKRITTVTTETLITKQIIQELISIVKKSASPTHNIFATQNAFNFPRYVFDSQDRSLIEAEKPNSVLGNAESKIDVYFDRYKILKLALLRTPMFQNKTQQIGLRSVSTLSLQSISSLISSNEEYVVVLGMISCQGDELRLEDPTGIVNFDLSSIEMDEENADEEKRIKKECIISVGNIVIANGVYKDDTFYANFVLHPPYTSREVFNRHFWRLPQDPFGWGLSPNAQAELNDLLITEHDSSLIVVFSDVWVDDQIVLNNFDSVLKLFASAPPNIIIITGSFTSIPVSFDKHLEFARAFQTFANIINNYPTIAQNTQIVLVPSMSDMDPIHVFPRPTLPISITSYLPKAHFLTNPARVRFLNQTIVVYRDDLLKRLSNAAIMPIPENETYKKLLEAVISQNHLCPIDLQHAPIAWTYDYAMRLFPTPDVLILADCCPPYVDIINDCCAINPGQFGNSCTYANYFPREKRAEIRTINP